jgi:type I restriction enzyme M protein
MDIKTLRERLGYTQEELAQRLGISTSAISKWEQGLRKPSRLANREIERLLKKAGISLKEDTCQK